MHVKKKAPCLRGRFVRLVAGIRRTRRSAARRGLFQRTSVFGWRRRDSFSSSCIDLPVHHESNIVTDVRTTTVYIYLAAVDVAVLGRMIETVRRRRKRRLAVVDLRAVVVDEQHVTYSRCTTHNDRHSWHRGLLK